MIKLSGTGKMPCRSWSLEARTHCPGSVKPRSGGELVAACKGCYAAGGNYRFPSVRAPRMHNAQDYKRAQWANDMVKVLETEDLFRWFDSGDVFTLALARKILEVMTRTPHVRHWLPTRMHKFPKFRKVFASMRRLPNVVVRLSSDSIEGKGIRGATTSTIYSDASQLPEHATICTAYQRGGKCGDCRACWNKDVSLIAYPGHGATMTRLQVIATDRAA